MKKTLLTICFILLIPCLSFPATHYIRSGATGSGSGEDWTNAYTDWPTFIRGDTYYLAGGTYGGDTWNVANDGSLKITIKKAYASDHGAAGDWDASYGTTQAYINGTIAVRTGYYVIDGQYRNENDWTEGTAYGIKMYRPSDSKFFETAFGASSTASNIEISYIWLQGQITGAVGRNDMIYMYYGGADWHIHHNFFRESNSVWFYAGWGGGGSDDAIVEYNYFWENATYPTQHGEGFQCIGGDGFILRYNVLRDAKGTAILSVNDCNNWKIYSNVFLDNDSFHGNGAIGVGNSAYSSSGFKVYGNTFVDGDCRVGLLYSYTNWSVINNIFLNCSQGIAFASGVSHSYNAADEAISETGFQSLTTSIFTDYSGDVFTLLSGTNA